MAGNSTEMSSQVLTSYDHASPVINSSYHHQQAHRLRVDQLVDQQKARAIQLKKNQQLLLMYHHAMVCRKKEGCGLPMCSKLKKTLEHAVLCDNANCTRSCLITQKVIRHFKLCHDPRCVLCGPVKESVRSAKIDHEESEKHDSLASDEPGPKRVRTDQPDVSTDQKKENEAKLVSDEKSVEELRVESVTDMELGCSIKSAKELRAESVTDMELCCPEKSAKEFRAESVTEMELCCSVKSEKEFRAESVTCVELDLSVNNSVKKTGVKSTADKALAKEARVKTVTHVVVNESDNEEPVKHLKDRDPLNNILEDGTKVGLVVNVESCANETIEETTKRYRGASLLDTFTLEEINIHLSSLRFCEKKVSWVSSCELLQLVIFFMNKVPFLLLLLL